MKSNENIPNSIQEERQINECKQKEITITEADLKEYLEAQQDYPELAHYPMALKIDQVAEILNVGRSSVDELVRSNRIRYVRIGKLIRIPRDAVYEFLHEMSA